MSIVESLRRLDACPRPILVVISLGMALIIGLFDYLSGYEIKFYAFYLLPVIFSGWFLGRSFGVGISIFCVFISSGGDWIAGERYSNSLVNIWNTCISLTLYMVVVWLLTSLRVLHDQLEVRVRERTAELNSVMLERMRLEQEILQISEREQRRIGHDLHDSLGQQLTGVALAGQVLCEQLEAKSLPESKTSARIVQMVEESIELTRSLARGLHPFELKEKDMGFTDALQELTLSVSDKFNIPCSFECEEPVVKLESESAIHLYRIAQEAVTNAVKHSRATQILVRLETTEEGTHLTIQDNGVGLSRKSREGKSLGLRIMAYRASVIGASFAIESLVPSGTLVACKLPYLPMPVPSHEGKNQNSGGG